MATKGSQLLHFLYFYQLMELIENLFSDAVYDVLKIGAGALLSRLTLFKKI